MITQQTVIDQIEITRAGPIQVRLGILLVEDGVEISHTWHRTVVEPGVDPAEQMAAVNAHLAALGQAQCPTSEIARLKLVVELVHTPEVVRRYQKS